MFKESNNNSDENDNPFDDLITNISSAPKNYFSIVQFS